jgi:hypothetical protein
MNTCPKNNNILLLFFTVVILINILNLVLKYVFNQNVFNFKDCLFVFDSSTIFFVFLSSGAEFLKEVLFSLSFVFSVIVLAYFSFYVIMIFYGFKYYLNLNKEELKIFCLKIQRVIHKNQTFIFSVTNGVLFLFLCQLFDPINCLIIHILWLDGLQGILFVSCTKTYFVRSFISNLRGLKSGYFLVL